MHDYQLTYLPTAGREKEGVFFQGNDATKALFIVQRKKGCRQFELWRDGERVCGIERANADTNDFWIIS